MLETSKRVLAAIVVAAVTYGIGVAILFLNYNWEVFVQFVKNFNIEVGITLIIPGVVAGGVLHALWPRRKKKS